MGLKASVESVMRSPPVTVLFSDTISSIVDRMISNNISAVVVMSGGAPTGMVTERDIVEKIVRYHRDATKTRADEVMSSPLISIEVDRNIADAVKLMRDKKTRRLAVTRKGRLVGILTESKLLDSLV